MRNTLLGEPPADTDICGVQSVEEFTASLQGSSFIPREILPRMNTALIKDTVSGESFEYTSFQSKLPKEATDYEMIKADALRRDFTVNAIYANALTGELIDPLNGYEDIISKTIRTVKEPSSVFLFDPLRILRMVRFAAQLGFTIEPSALSAAKNLINQVPLLAKERITDEFDKILHADQKYPALTKGRALHAEALYLMKEMGLLFAIIPALQEGDGLNQRKDFHRYDVLTHILETVRFSHPSVRYAALLHDIAKPKMLYSTGKFAAHDKEGAKMAQNILRNDLLLPKKDVSFICMLIKLHMYDMDGKTSERKLRKFLVKNAAYTDALLLLKQADYMGCGYMTDTSPTVLRFTALREKMKTEGVPFSLRELAVSGYELQSATGLPPERTSEALQYLLLHFANHPKQNTVKGCIALTKKWLDGIASSAK
ncbi:MAG: CCA tRNA nucleotidyltransferase [Clostridia bacterium]|nr:CCA tRNA nucleotidyltransferase [Clostridia bacterium]